MLTLLYCGLENTERLSPSWENGVQQRPGIHMAPRRKKVSRSAADGICFVCCFIDTTEPY